jgi:hypothetical protein
MTMENIRITNTEKGNRVLWEHNDIIPNGDHFGISIMSLFASGDGPMDALINFTKRLRDAKIVLDILDQLAADQISKLEEDHGGE